MRQEDSKPLNGIAIEGTRSDSDADQRSDSSSASDISSSLIDRPGLYPVAENNYALHREIAKGGMGRVMAAIDVRHGRPVAIKELLHTKKASRHRFEREALITARLQHPSIVPVYEAGKWPSGEPFYAMKLVEGRTLKDVIAETGSFDERLALLPKVIAVAEAIAYAHSQRVIHRDLKPSNVVIGPFGESVVIDWGLAKDLTDTAPEEDLQAGPYRTLADERTVAGAILGTPAYMPPEQARAERVDERADVYALGAILYHLLGGKAPYHGHRSDEVLGRVLDHSPEQLVDLQPGVPRDLIAVVEKAMARDPSRRYCDASELAADLKRFQTGQLVGAHHYSKWMLLQRMLLRHRVAVGLSTAFLTCMIVVGFVSIRRIVKERNRAEHSSNQLILEQARLWMDRDPTSVLGWLARYLEHGEDVAAAQTLAADAVSRGVARLVLSQPDKITRAAYSPDGSMIATISVDDVLRIWDAKHGTQLQRHQSAHGLYQMAISERGTIAAAGLNGPILVTDSNGRERVLHGHKDFVQSLTFSPDGGKLASSSCDDTVKVWDLDRDRVQEFSFHQPRMSNLVFNSDGSLLVGGGSHGEVRIWNLHGGPATTLTGHTGEVAAVALSPNGRLLLSAGQDGNVQLREFPSGKPVSSYQIHAMVPQLAFSPDGSGYAAIATDDVVWVWSVGTQAPMAVLRGHGARVTAMAFSRDGKQLATADGHGVVRVWDFPGGHTQLVLKGHQRIISALQFSPDNRELISSSIDHTVRVWPLSTPSTITAHTGRAYDIRFAPDGSRFASASADYTAKIWDREGRLIANLKHDNIVVALAFTVSGELVTVSYDRTLRIWRPDGQLRARIPIVVSSPGVLSLSPDGANAALAGATAEAKPIVQIFALDRVSQTFSTSVAATIEALAWAPDSTTLALADEAGDMLLWEPGKQPPKTIAHQDGTLYSVAYSPDGRMLSGAGDFGAVTVIDLSNGHQTIFGHEGPIYALSFSPDGNSLATAGRDGNVKLWPLPNGEARQLGHLESRLLSLAFSADGKLLSARADGAVHLWRLSDGNMLTLSDPSGQINELALSPSEDLLVAASEDFTIHLWHTNLPTVPRDRSQLLRWILSRDAVKPNGNSAN